MPAEVKAIMFGVGLIALMVVGSFAASTEVSRNKIAAYRECIAANERMAAMLVKANTETLRVSSLPSCHM